VVRLARRLRVDEVRAGVTVPIRCSAACTVAANLVARGKALGTGRAHLGDAGSTFLFVRIPAKKLKKVKRSKATLRLTVAETGARVSRSLELRR
jgi:hypothetical protein